ncbi:MAG: acyl-ACP--UDP-N-acetylglucosamine O-acyltransferase [Candidatus Riflebacteria bacterium]|nr:acyl-ACP--UDP-N-acetylglucosamine O-acyltransferase [Candidatus Riflebacteria bacterium]
MTIHPTAIIHEGADLAQGVTVGPYSIIGANVKIGEGTIIGSSARVVGNTEIGKNNIIHDYVYIGGLPQDTKFSGEKSYIRIGDGNQIREFTTIHLAKGEGELTVLGNNNFLMSYSHVAHNCVLGNNIIMSNNSTLAGHVTLDDNVVIGGLSGVHQFCRIGKMVMVGGMTKVTKDVAPFLKIDGNPPSLAGLNSVGLRRNGVPEASLKNLKHLYKVVFMNKEMNLSQILERWEELVAYQDPYIQYFKEFAKNSKRGIYWKSGLDGSLKATDTDSQ